MAEYTEDDMLMLSGIQHFAFCPRQWALIHINQQWDDNRLTAEGELLHQHVDDPFYRQKNGSIICLRSVSIASRQLGLYGVSDIIELHPSSTPDNAITHPTYPGYWTPFPIEYKHGKPKNDSTDIVQLAAQALCLEEQYNIRIAEGAIFYGETCRRELVTFDDELRNEVTTLSNSMHQIFESGVIPQATKQPKCRSCSLRDICMPETSYSKAASNYLKINLYAETP